MKHALRLMVWLTVGLFAICAAIIGHAAFIEKPWLTYQNLPFPPVLATITAGSAIPLEVERCNSSKVKKYYETTRRLVHLPKPGEMRLEDRILESRKVDINPGCHRTISTLSNVPLGTPSGTWQVTGLALVPGLLGTTQVPWYSESIEVIQK